MCRDYPGRKENWQPGDRAFFQYDCYRSHESTDARAWYRSHQPVTVLAMTEEGGGDTMTERVQDAGMPRTYQVRFPDGFEHDAWEYELYESAQLMTEDLAPPPVHEIRDYDPEWVAYMDDRQASVR